MKLFRLVVVLAVVALAATAFAQAPSPQDETKAAITPYLSFVGVTPCRLVDTRETGFPAGYGTPALGAGSTRTFVIPEAVCGIPTTAKAVSMNVTVVSPGAPGFLALWPGDPADQPSPLVSSLNYVPGDVVPNAVIVPLDASGQVTALTVAATNVIFDVNGYFTDTPAAQVTYNPPIFGPLGGQGTVQAAISRLAGGWTPGRVMTSSILGTLLDEDNLLWDAINNKMTIENGRLAATGVRGRSYIGVSPTTARTTSSALTLTPGLFGDLDISATATGGNRYVYIPVTIPTRLLGTVTRFVDAKVCYRTSNAASFINDTRVRQLGDNLTEVTLATNNVDQAATGTGANCYNIPADTATTTNGALNIMLNLTFGATTHTITIGNVEVVLDQI